MFAFDGTGKYAHSSEESLVRRGAGAVEITLDKQVASQHCPECNADFTVVRGSVYDGGQGFGLYLIALHGHSPQGPLGHLAIALLDRSDGQPVPLAAAMDWIAMPEQLGFALVEWEASPWRDEGYLGRMLSPAEVQSSPHRPTFFHIAEHVVENLPEVRAYFAEPGAAPDQARPSGILSMVLRALIVAQISSVALLGVASRGTLPGPQVREWAESAAALSFYPVLLGFPLAVSIVSRRVGMPSWKRRILLGVEAALVFATLVAILPAVQ